MKTSKKLAKRKVKRQHIVTSRPPRNPNEDNVGVYAQLVRFYPGSPMRESYRVFYYPHSIRDLDKLLDDTEPGYYKLTNTKEQIAFSRKMGALKRKTTRSTLKLEIVLTYPLTKKMRKVVTIDKRYPGELFGLAYDFYKEIYDEDDKRGGMSYANNDPDEGLPFNRRSMGPLVWGHDMSDLVFESIEFSKVRKRKDGVVGVIRFGMGS